MKIPFDPAPEYSAHTYLVPLGLIDPSPLNHWCLLEERIVRDGDVLRLPA